MNKRTSFFIKQNFKKEVQDLLTEIRKQEKQMKEKKEKFSLFKDSKALELQCLGYGLFDQNEALTNYQYFLDQISDQLLKEEGNFSLIVTISGFDFKQAEKTQFLTSLKNKIQSLKSKLEGLSIQTSNLQNVTKKNFQEFLSLALNTKKQFRKFNLQCSNWNFLDGLRPTYKNVSDLFEQFNKETQKNPLNIIKFRLELSAWYHKYEQALNFLGYSEKPSNGQFLQYEQSKFSSQIQSMFFNGMEKLLRQLFQGLPQLEQFELDLRNNHQVLKLKNLKKKLDTMNIKEHLEPTNVVQSSLLSAIIKMNSHNVEMEKKKAVTINYIV